MIAPEHGFAVAWHWLFACTMITGFGINSEDEKVSTSLLQMQHQGTGKELLGTAGRKIVQRRNQQNYFDQLDSMNMVQITNEMNETANFDNVLMQKGTVLVPVINEKKRAIKALEKKYGQDARIRSTVDKLTTLYNANRQTGTIRNTLHNILPTTLDLGNGKSQRLTPKQTSTINYFLDNLVTGQFEQEMEKEHQEIGNSFASASLTEQFEQEKQQETGNVPACVCDRYNSPNSPPRQGDMTDGPALHYGVGADLSFVVSGGLSIGAVVFCEVSPPGEQCRNNLALELWRSSLWGVTFNAGFEISVMFGATQTAADFWGKAVGFSMGGGPFVIAQELTMVHDTNYRQIGIDIAFNGGASIIPVDAGWGNMNTIKLGFKRRLCSLYECPQLKGR